LRDIGQTFFSGNNQNVIPRIKRSITRRQNKFTAPNHKESIKAAKAALKGTKTVITDGFETYINPTGNPGMAVGGCGDVLSGIIAALIGQGISPVLAAACGAWLHGAAGDLCADQLGQYGMLPTDMLQILPRLLK